MREPEPLFVAISVNGCAVRLTATVWRKIESDHLEFEGRQDYMRAIQRVIEQPDYIVEGRLGGLIALSWCEIAPVRPKHLATVYRELNGDGFVITAFFISRVEQLLKRGILWQKKS